jgi:hypothetical protein
MKIGYFFLATLLATLASLSAHAAVTATVSKNHFATGETIQLRIQRDGSADGQPDISPLRKEFDVLGSSSGSNVQIINGKVSTQTQITLLLSPRHEGKIQIPPLHWSGEQTAAIELTIGSGGAAPQQGGSQTDTDTAHVFITTTLDQKQVYVQAAVVMTMRLYYDQQLLQASLDFPPNNDVLVKQLGKDTPTSEVRNGHTYQIIERKYVLFPQRSGKLSLKGPVLDAQVQDSNSNDPFDSFFRRMPFGGAGNITRPLRVNAKPIELSVLPRPASVSGPHWLPAQKVTLEEKKEIWGQDKTTVHVGEPLTRLLRLEAVGLTGAQLPDPNTLMTVPEGLKAYPDQAIIADTQQGNTVVGSREQNIALIASHPGHYELPAIKLSWWDALHNEAREVKLPAHTIEVLPAAATGNASAIPLNDTDAAALFNPGAQSSAIDPACKLASKQPWMWLSLVLALLWLATLAAWWRTHKMAGVSIKAVTETEAPSPVIHGGNAFKAIRRACNNNDAHEARKHLLAWASTIWPDDVPQGLNELTLRLQDPQLIEELRKLDKACYTDSPWQGINLTNALAHLPQKTGSAKAREALPDLYS